MFCEARGTGFKIWIFLWFSHGEQVSKFGFFCGFLRFLRGGVHPIKSQNWVFSVVSWEFEGWVPPKIDFKTQIYLQFS
jgi:hypothetical protein